MVKIPFDVRYRPQIESGEYKVETRDGRPVRIICWDVRNNCYPIMALIDRDGDDVVVSYTINGRFWENPATHSDKDLFIVTPDEELTEFEKEVASWMGTAKDKPITNEMIVDAADNLMFIARKQIEAEKKPPKRLPTIEEWMWLIDNCEWKWDENRKGQVVTAKNGNSIFLPAAGDDSRLNNAGFDGFYWSSSLNTDYPYFAYSMYFYSDNVHWSDYDRDYGQSIRPVSDTPMKGFVDMGNGLFWAEKNEEGYFTYDDAMKLFNS